MDDLNKKLIAEFKKKFGDYDEVDITYPLYHKQQIGKFPWEMPWVKKRKIPKKYQHNVEAYLEIYREKERIRKTKEQYKKKYGIILKTDQIEMAKRHRVLILKALPILSFLNELELIHVNKS
jgi:hypothetical protein